MYLEGLLMRIFISILLMMLIIITGCTNDEKVKFETITIDEIPALQQQGYTILDVREVDEYDEGHIPNAQNKPLTDLHLGNFEDLQTSQKYIVICRSGNRSEDASEILAEKGYDVTNVSTGMSSWTGEIEQ